MAKKSRLTRNSHTKESHAVIQEALLHAGKLGALKKKTQQVVHQEVAHSLNISGAMLYKWREAPPKGETISNPLERVAILINATGDEKIADWIAHKSGGHFIPDELHADAPQLVQASHSLIKDFSLLITELIKSCEDQQVCADESVALREKWNLIRKRAESFVRACEKGTYDPR